MLFERRGAFETHPFDRKPDVGEMIPPVARRRVEGCRLVYYERVANASYWDSLWTEERRTASFDGFARGQLYFLRQPFLRYLPSTGKILEAGCGTAQWVVSLRARGFDCIGVDYAQGALAAANRARPDLPLLAGDIARLPFRSESFAAVISLGVVEHRVQGPEPYLAEMRRIIAPGGRLLVSVPSFNVIRRTRHRLGGYDASIGDAPFYQYAFSDTEFTRLLGEAEFRLVDRTAYDVSKCLRQDVPGIRHLPHRLQGVLSKGLSLLPGVGGRIGHMRLFIAEAV